MTISVHSVTEITTGIRELLESTAWLHDVWVAGEVSNMTRASSGHWYFTIKDAGAQLKCVMWRSSTERQTTVPRDGDAIEVRGYVSVYEPRGEYQLYANLIRPVGMGDLYQQFEALKARLQAEGLFEEDRKRPIPAFPQQIGVVTSPDAAAFQDIQNVLRRRFPLAEVILSPTPVQGTDAPPQIAAALRRLNDHTTVDVILMCRGGGSIEDLWAFNDERVARAVVNSRIPVITGVGHETDFTIVDFVSDVRAPTPSAAAELATPNIEDLADDLEQVLLQMTQLLRDTITTRRADMGSLYRNLLRESPLSYIQTMRQRMDDLNMHLLSIQRGRIALLGERVASRSNLLNAANPQSILARGYAIVYRSDDGVRVQSAKDAQPGMGITIQLHDDELKARVEDKESHGQYRRTLF